MSKGNKSKTARYLYPLGVEAQVYTKLMIMNMNMRKAGVIYPLDNKESHKPIRRLKANEDAHCNQYDLWQQPREVYSRFVDSGESH